MSKNIFLQFRKLLLDIKYPLIIFILLNLLLYSFIFFFHPKIKFNNYNYFFNSHHYLQDDRAYGGRSGFLRILGQYDAQWYLKIAREGYPKNPAAENIEDKKVMKGLSYAFFPLYPMSIKAFSLIFGDVELSAFILSIVVLIIDFISLIFVLTKILDKKIAIKTAFLLFFFPFAIFFRSYFTEGLYLGLLIWFSYFIFKKKYFSASIFLGLINVTKANGFLINLVFLLYLVLSAKKKFILSDFIKNLIPAFLPFLIWMLFCYLNSGNFIYFLSVRSAWNPNNIPLFIYFFFNLYVLTRFFQLPFHSFHVSQIDSIAILFIVTLLINSRRHLNNILWLISLALWLSPLVVHDSMSFTRYQIVSFPLFVYLAQILNDRYYYIILTLSLLLLLLLSLFFVNWYWIG